LETKDLTDFTFVWFTDGKGWNSARRNLEETFDVLEHIYNINDMENGIISKIMK
jgi:type II restriction enzyme